MTGGWVLEQTRDKFPLPSGNDRAYQTRSVAEEIDGPAKAIDYDLLTQIGARERMTTIIGEDTPLSRLFEMCYAPQYRLITVKFLSTFIYRPVDPDFQPQPDHPQSPKEISFRLCGESYDMSLREFAIVSGLYTEEETHMPIYTTAISTADDAVVSAWWPRIGDEPFVRAARVTRIRDPLIRYLHRCIVSSITGRGMSHEWCTSHDLFFFILFVEWENVPPCTVFGGVLLYLLPPPGERPDLRGVYVTRIARFHGLIDIEPAYMEVVYHIRLDSRTMHGMHIVQRFPHLWLRFALEKRVIWPQPQPQPQPQL
ncbi:hypothetical protein R6Q57_006487 [Mikania cordata]